MPLTVVIAPPTAPHAKPIQPSRQGRPKATKEQRVSASGRRLVRDTIVHEKLEEVWGYITRQAEELAETCGNKPEYYTRLIFSGGVNKMKERRSNPFNAWSHQLMKDKENGE